jgi:tetratricopeptide (TPR) repeat protein
MLTERDRATAHRVAGAWLEASGEDDAMILAEHAARGGDPRRAAIFSRRAAEQALRADDLDAAVAAAERGLAAGPEGELRAALVATLLEAHAWRNDWAAGARWADEILAREPPGSRSWCMAALVLVWAAPMLGQLDGMVQAMGPLAVVDPHPGAASELVQALAAVVMALTVVSQHDLAATYLARMDEVAAVQPGPVVRGWTAVARGYALRQREGDLAASFALMSAARAAFAEAGNPHQIAWAELHMGLDLWLLGDPGAAIRVIRAGAGSSGKSLPPPFSPVPREPPRHLPVVASLGKFVVANALLEMGQEHLARGEAEAMVEAEAAQRNRFFEGLGRSTLAEVHRAAGDREAAAREATTAIELLEAVPYDRAIALSRLALLRVEEGRAAEAVRLAGEAVTLLAAAPGYAEPRVRLALAEALWATGKEEEARASLAETRRRLAERAATLPEERREAYLTKVPAHARIGELAQKWG